MSCDRCIQLEAEVRELRNALQARVTLEKGEHYRVTKVIRRKLVDGKWK
jgi:hypothetical protein